MRCTCCKTLEYEVLPVLRSLQGGDRRLGRGQGDNPGGLLSCLVFRIRGIFCPGWYSVSEASLSWLVFRVRFPLVCGDGVGGEGWALVSGTSDTNGRGQRGSWEKR